MAYYSLTLDLSVVETLTQFHEELKNTFGFPDSYERNARGLIDSLSALRQPEESKSKFILAQQEDILVLTVKSLSEKNKTIIRDFITAIEAVNYRYFYKGAIPPILLNLLEF